MYIAGSDFTSKMDKTCIERYHMPEIMLMENAAEVGVRRILSIEVEKNILFGNVLIICGCGNNGGDGFAIARKLFNAGRNVSVAIIGNTDKMSCSAETNYKITLSIGIETIYLDSKKEIFKNSELINKIKKSDAVVDCIFGAGLNREIQGGYREIIDFVNTKRNDYGFYTISIDIPSGINGSTGDVMGISIMADFTITFEFYKRGFLRYSAEKYTGEIFTEKIGIPQKLYNEIEADASFIDEDYVIDNLIIKDDYAHKGDFGKSVIIAGSRGFYGAAYLSTESCVKSGAGLTTLICDEDIQNIMAIKLNEAMTCAYSDAERVDKLLKSANAVAFGPGLGNTEKTEENLKEVLKKIESPIVIDADGINVFKPEYIVNSGDCILTPHLGEFSRLTGISINEIEKDRLKHAKKYADENGVIIVLKGKNTIVTDGIRTMVNTTGNSAMANGGMGDTLTGIITSLCGQGYESFTAAVIGVYLHGKCGDSIFKQSQTVNAIDLIKTIPQELKIMYNKVNK